MLQIILTIGVFLLPIIVESKGHWSYENINNWSHDYHYCSGNVQSPIDLKFDLAKYDRRLKPIHFQSQYSLDSLQLINNGHSALLNFNNHYILKPVTPQGENYKVAQLHFHWSHLHDNTSGSEHLLEGRSYPLEMHIVSYSGYFSNVSEAATNTRGLAVVGVLFELSDQQNEFLQPIIHRLEHIRHKDKQQSISEENFTLTNLLDENHLRRYYRYDGSLTTPPCYESVIWSVLKEPLKLSLNQLDAFRNLHDEKNKLMKNTFRPVQPMGTRKLFRSFHEKNIDDEPIEHVITGGCHGQYLSINIKIVFVLISFLMINI